MVNLRKKLHTEDISSASMSDIAFLLLVFFMVASVFYVKEGIASSMPKKDSKPQVVLRENVYRVTLQGDQVRLEHPSIRNETYESIEKFAEEFRELEIANLPEKYAVLTARPPTSVQQMVSVLGAVRERGFKKISLQKK
jgi:biopolymer transport protein ExbD